MPLPEPMLDDLRFQKIVDEARRRIIHYCPEWTDYNLSDPGITLIELFAYIAETLGYRLNRVPEKNYIRFLELNGFQLQPAVSARTEMTFWLSAPIPFGPEDTTVVTVPQGTEVTTRRTEEEPEVIFTTDEKLTIAAPALVHLRREADVNKNYLSRLGIEPFVPFRREQPVPGETFYLGFDENQDISGHIVRLTFACDETEGTGIRREDPPLVWECSMGAGKWQEIVPSVRSREKDTTGGLNNANGSLVLYFPLEMKRDAVHGKAAYWVRCRFEPRRPEQGKYTASPRIMALAVHTLGAATRATHAVVVEDEPLGQSNGDPGQIVQLKHRPVLGLRRGETVEVEEERDGEAVFIPWQVVPDFADSERYDRHFSLDTASGEVAFGPSIRQPDGTVRQYGRVPEAGRMIRFTSYRHGGGGTGNVPAGKLQVLRTAIAFVDRVANLVRAEGGRDQESLEEIKLRARRELRAQRRAVTAGDYQDLTRAASRAVARVRCLAPGEGPTPPPPGTVELLVVPSAYDALRAGDRSRLFIDQPLRKEIAGYLDPMRLLTTTLYIREPRYIGVRVHVEITPSEYIPPEVVKARVDEALRCFISPLPLGTADPEVEKVLGEGWDGWAFGRDLYPTDIFNLVQHVPGVKYVLAVELWQREVIPSKEGKSPEAGEQGSAQELLRVEERFLAVPEDTLLCSLDHDVQVVEP